MALSGTLETFSLPDVLRLLSATKKTGVLSVEGDRGTGHAAVRDGRLVDDDVDGTVFTLLRFRSGSFEFDNTVEVTDGGHGADVEEALVAAEGRLEEWRSIEAVVPSLDVVARLADSIAGPVTIHPDQWSLLTRIGTGASGHDVSAHLGAGEFETCRTLRDLSVAGLVEVAEAAPLAEDDGAVADALANGVLANDVPVNEVLVADDRIAAEAAPQPAVDALETVAPAEPSGWSAPEDTDDDGWAHDDAEAVDGSSASTLGGEQHDFPATADVEDSDDLEVDRATFAAAGIDDADVLGSRSIDHDLDGHAGDHADEADSFGAGIASAVAGALRDAIGTDADDVPPFTGAHEAIPAATVEATEGGFLDQLSNLSPKAAAAIEATASPEDAGIADEAAPASESGLLSSLVPDAEGAADADTPAEGDGEDINQNLLLRFLSSAKQ